MPGGPIDGPNTGPRQNTPSPVAPVDITDSRNKPMATGTPPALDWQGLPQWEQPTFMGSYANMPGWSPAQGLNAVQYNDWLFTQARNPTFQQLVQKYGPQYQALAWYGARTNMDPNAFANLLRTYLPGATDNGSGPRGGGGGASRADNIAAAVATVRNQASTIGLQMTDQEILFTAVKAVDDNWTSPQLTDYLLSDVAKITNKGTYTQTQDQIKAMAKQQLINISDQTAAEWAKKVLSDEMDINTVSTILAGQAKSEFGWAAEQIAGGATMSDILAPTRDTIARELELNPQEIDLTDSRFRSMVQVEDPQGKPRAATLTEAVRLARKDAAYAKTAGAARSAAGVATMMRQIFEGS